MELGDYIRILRKNWLVIAAATLVGIAIAAMISLTRMPLYEASSTVFVSTQGGGTVAELQQGSTFTQARVTTYTNLVSTPIVIDPVIDELRLDQTSAELAENISATSPTGTTLISISVTGPDPEKAAVIADALARSLTSAVEEIETPAGSDISPVRLTGVKGATVPLAPASPNVPLYLVVGAILGLAGGIAASALRTVLDTRVRSPRDLTALTDRPLIGTIPMDPKAKERPLIVHAEPLSPRAEAFRTLRTNLQFVEVDGGASFVVTSSIPSEGKSTTTINLAIALADAGQRVALIDTDLRKPKVAEYLSIEGGVGLTDVLIGRARVADVMLPWGRRSLYVLPAGKIPPNPSELLGSKQMSQLLEALGREFDVVLCDAPPLLPVTDAAVLSQITGRSIMVVASGRTTRHQVTQAFEALKTVGAQVAGVVMTMAPTRGPDAYSYGYGYGYGYGYRTDQTGATVRAADTGTVVVPRRQRPAAAS